MDRPGSRLSMSGPRRLLRTAATVSATAALVACGSEVSTSGEVPSEEGSASVSAEPRTRLTIDVLPAPGKAPRTFALTCDPIGGDHPDPEAACRRLDTLDRPLAPVPAGAMCTEIFGGPQTATVSGTLHGDPVEASFSRENGCEIARWDDHVPLLVVRGGVRGN